MLRGGWHVAVAFGLILAGSAYAQQSGGAALEGKPVTTGGQPERSAASQKPAADHSSITEKLVPAIEKIEPALRQLVPKEDKDESQRKEQREVSDLQAQQEMALWAKLMFWATFATVGLTFLGLMLIRGTLRETRRAADYTKDMLAEAEKTTKAAEQAVAQQVTAVRRLERPYLFIKIVSTNQLRSRPASGPFIEYVIHNEGKLPAVLRTITDALWDTPSLPLPLDGVNMQEFFAVVAPGASTDPITLKVSNVVAAEYSGETAANLVLYARLAYDDPTGARHIDQICLRGTSGGRKFRIDGDEYNKRESTYPD